MATCCFEFLRLNCFMLGSCWHVGVVISLQLLQTDCTTTLPASVPGGLAVLSAFMPLKVNDRLFRKLEFKPQLCQCHLLLGQDRLHSAC